MEKERLIRLTAALYKITEGFPDREPLRTSLREKALNILGCKVLLLADNPVIEERRRGQIVDCLLQEASCLEAYFELAKKQPWAEGQYLDVLSREYEKIKEEAVRVGEKKIVKTGEKEERPLTKEKREAKEKPTRPSLEKLKKPRHKKIIKILEEQESAQVKDFEKYFPGLTKRTLRRDMHYLLGLGMVKRVGDKSNTFYQLK